MMWLIFYKAGCLESSCLHGTMLSRKEHPSLFHMECIRATAAVGVSRNQQLEKKLRT